MGFDEQRATELPGVDSGFVCGVVGGRFWPLGFVWASGCLRLLGSGRLLGSSFGDMGLGFAGRRSSGAERFRALGGLGMC